ncbi:MAG: Trm112 family protein [Candidatus Promineifilaceae bacterium]
MSESTKDLPISEDLLEILRDPAAVQEPERYGDDPGRLELVHNAWLVSKDTGYKYPIRDGIPVMLVEEGARWKDTPVDQLPMPPEAAEPLARTPEQPDLFISERDSGAMQPLVMVAAMVAALLAFFGLWRWLTRNKE